VIGSAIADQLFADHGVFGDSAYASDYGSADPMAAGGDQLDAGGFDGGFDVSDV
jgi:hypothetical protein